MRAPQPTPLSTEVRRQLERMLQSSVFAARPRSAAILRAFVEESIRNGFAPLDDHAIATPGLGISDGPGLCRTAEVQAKIAGLRAAIGRYYAGLGPDDPVVFDIMPEPCRLVVTSSGVASDGTPTGAGSQSRHMLPLLVVVEPDVSGLQRPDLLAQGMSLLLISLLVKSPRVTISGLLRADRIAAATESVAAHAGKLGYEFVVQSWVRAEGVRCEVRMTIAETNRGEPVAEDATAFDPWGTDSLAGDIAGWMNQRVEAAFASQG